MLKLATLGEDHRFCETLCTLAVGQKTLGQANICLEVIICVGHQTQTCNSSVITATDANYIYSNHYHYSTLSMMDISIALLLSPSQLKTNGGYSVGMAATNRQYSELRR